MKHLTMALVLGLATAAPAAADCYYAGTYYPAGSTICSAGGWLEQCTETGGWSAIGQCNRPDGKAGKARADGAAQDLAARARAIRGNGAKDERLSKAD